MKGSSGWPERAIYPPRFNLTPDSLCWLACGRSAGKPTTEVRQMNRRLAPWKRSKRKTKEQRWPRRNYIKRRTQGRHLPEALATSHRCNLKLIVFVVPKKCGNSSNRKLRSIASTYDVERLDRFYTVKHRRKISRAKTGVDYRHMFPLY